VWVQYHTFYLSFCCSCMYLAGGVFLGMALGEAFLHCSHKRKPLFSVVLKSVQVPSSFPSNPNAVVTATILWHQTNVPHCLTLGKDIDTIQDEPVVLSHLNKGLETVSSLYNKCVGVHAWVCELYGTARQMELRMEMGLELWIQCFRTM
jgi:hypothetical protein